MKRFKRKQIKYWRNDMYHKSEMRKFMRLQFEQSEKNHTQNMRILIVGSIISGALISSPHWMPFFSTMAKVAI